MSEWIRRDGSLYMTGYSDVFVEFAPDMEGRPFAAYVGECESRWATLDMAQMWCADVAHGRDVLRGEAPMGDEMSPNALVVDADEAIAQRTDRFFEERGLKP